LLTRVALAERHSYERILRENNFSRNTPKIDSENDVV
jgi:hypothetical protein